MNRIRSTRAALAMAVALIVTSLAWPLVGATLYWTTNGSQSTAWNTTDKNWTQTGTADGVAPGPADGSVYTDGGVDNVIFKRDMPTAGRTIAVQPAGVQPRWLRVDTSGNWDFSGGLINGPLYYNPNSGGGSQLRFNGYTTSMGFTAVTNGSFSSIIIWNFAGGPGAYRFCSTPIKNVGSYAAEFRCMPSGAAGVYEWQDDFELNCSGFTLKGGNGSSGRTNLFSGNILLNTTLTVTGDSTIMPRFSGTVTVSGDRTISFSSSGEGIVDWADATFSGSASMLTFGTDNAQFRAQRLPSTGSRLGVQNLRLLNESWVIVNPTNAVEDYFAPLRSLGGKVTLAGFGSTSGGWLYLQTGSFRSSDIVATTSTTSTAVGCLVFDTTATNRNLTLDG